MNWTALVILVLLFGLVTVLGFIAARWRRGDLKLLEEWGLAGRRFGTWVTWFLLGGDVYTAYTFVAVPALMFGAGAMGFFALPYTIIIYPFAFLVFPKLWQVARRHGFVTASDFVQARYGSSALALAVAITGIVSTMPYIALQLTGLQVVIGALGFNAEGWVGDLPLIVAFAILAAYTYTSGLRAPAIIAVVKDTLIYLTIAVAIVVIPMKLGGFAHIFAAVPADKLLLKPPDANSLNGYSAYATLAFGSALALFLYPHTITGILSANSGSTVRRNMALLPAYTLVLGLLALPDRDAEYEGIRGFFRWLERKKYKVHVRVFLSRYRGYLTCPDCGGARLRREARDVRVARRTIDRRRRIIRYSPPHRETSIAKIVSLIMKLGALGFIVFLPLQYAIQLQLLGGIWIVQTLPAIVFGLYTRWLDHRALLLGWLAGIVSGTWMAGTLHFNSTTFALHLGSFAIPGYAAVYSLVLNIVVAVIATEVVRALKLAPSADQTEPADYVDHAAA